MRLIAELWGHPACQQKNCSVHRSLLWMFWYSGTVVLWYFVTVVLWYCGTVVLWYCVTLVQLVASFLNKSQQIVAVYCIFNHCTETGHNNMGIFLLNLWTDQQTFKYLSSIILDGTIRYAGLLVEWLRPWSEILLPFLKKWCCKYNLN